MPKTLTMFSKPRWQHLRKQIASKFYLLLASCALFCSTNLFAHSIYATDDNRGATPDLYRTSPYTANNCPDYPLKG